MTAPPERGRANRAVLELLAGALDLAPSQLELAAGAGSADKVVLIPLPPEEVRRRLGNHPIR